MSDVLDASNASDESDEPSPKRVKTDQDEAEDQTQVEDIDAEGDVIVVCRKYSMRVSSKVLSLASPVFKNLLGPGFREGNFERSTTSPLKLELPEDDDAAMATLLKIMHPSTKPSPQDNSKQGPDCYKPFEEVAILADKYFCQHVIYYVCYDWCFDLASSSKSMQQLDTLAKVAYIARNYNLFRLITTQMMDRHSAELEHVSSLCLRSILQAKKLKEVEIRQNLLLHVQQSIDSLQNTSDRIHKRGSSECTGKHRMNRYIDFLNEASLNLPQIREMKHPGDRDYTAASRQIKSSVPGCAAFHPTSCPLSRAWLLLRSGLVAIPQLDTDISVEELSTALRANDFGW